MKRAHPFAKALEYLTTIGIQAIILPHVSACIPTTRMTFIVRDRQANCYGSRIVTLSEYGSIDLAGSKSKH